MTLAALIRKNQFLGVATQKVATFATDGTETPPTVATVATVAVANPTDAKTAHWHWIVQLPDRVIETYHHPAATRAEVLLAYPEALDLEPMPEPSRRETPELGIEWVST